MADEQSPWLPTGWPNMPPSWNRPQWAVELEGLKHLNRELTEADIEKTESWEKLYTAEVGFCGNVPLNASQQNQYHFETMAARVQYFKQKLRLRAGVKDPENYVPRNYYIYNNTAQIRDKGVMLVGTAVRNMESCNYLFIHNKYQENADIERQRWYFCFITRVEYVAPSTTAVYYEVDPIQTYWLDLNMKPSYIERMTPDNDNLFGNTTQEGLDFGPTAVSNHYFLPIVDPRTAQAPLSAIVTGGDMPVTNQFVEAFWYTTPESDGRQQNGKLWVPMSMNYFNVPGGTIPAIGEVPEMRAFFQQNGHTIVTGWIMPLWMLQVNYVSFLSQLNVDFSAAGNGGKLYGGYVPKNKKLYCYPYSFLEVINNLGSTQEYRYEWFNPADRNGTLLSCPFVLNGGCDLSPTAYLTPQGYLGEGSIRYSTLLLPYGEFPPVPWTSDAFNAWFQSNESRTALESNTRKAHTWINTIGSGIQGAIDTVSKGAGAVGSALTGDFGGAIENVGQAASSLVNTAQTIGNGVTDIISQAYEFDAIKEDLTRTSDTVGGFAPGGMFNYMVNRFGWTFRTKSITPEYAFKIDSYFTKKGYHYGAVIQPTMTMPRGYKYFEIPRLNIFPRTNTQMEYGVPSNAILKIQQAFANGITFWVPPPLTPGVEPEDTVGNYGAWMPAPPPNYSM